MAQPLRLDETGIYWAFMFDVGVFAVVALVQVLWFHGLTQKLGLEDDMKKPTKQKRRVAWVLSLGTSAVLALSGPVWVLFAAQAPSLTVWLDTEGWGSRTLTIFFAVYLVHDLLRGLTEYPSEMGWLEGWVHHTVYLAIVLSLLWTRSTHSFALFALAELPTFILALGHVQPHRRADMLFGATFFLTRVVLCAMGFAALALYGTGRVRQAVSVPIMCLHLFWFYRWVVSQRKQWRNAWAAAGTAAQADPPLRGGLGPSPDACGNA